MASERIVKSDYHTWHKEWEGPGRMADATHITLPLDPAQFDDAAVGVE